MRRTQNARLFYGSSGVRCGGCGLNGHNRRSPICSEHRYSVSGRNARYRSRCVARERRERRLFEEAIIAERREIRQRAQEEFNTRLAITTLQRRGQLSSGSRINLPFPRIGENESIRSYLQRRGELHTSHSGLRRDEARDQRNSNESRGESGIPIAQAVPFTPGKDVSFDMCIFDLIYISLLLIYNNFVSFLQLKGKDTEAKELLNVPQLNGKGVHQVPVQVPTPILCPTDSTVADPSESKHVAPMPLKYQARRLPQSSQDGISTVFQQSMHNQMVIRGTDPTKPAISLSESEADEPPSLTSVTNAATFVRTPDNNPFFVGGLEARLESNGFEKVASRASNDTEKKPKVLIFLRYYILFINLFIYLYFFLFYRFNPPSLVHLHPRLSALRQPMMTLVAPVQYLVHLLALNRCLLHSG